MLSSLCSPKLCGPRKRGPSSSISYDGPGTIPSLPVSTGDPTAKHWWFSGRILACHAGDP
ncbi:hypothetical protein ABG768_027932, partial [Culter alburnus]